ncbi:hypothetical protein DFAR_2990006 [Desulfarculales bacterium]
MEAVGPARAGHAPRKSTYFYSKVLTSLVLHLIVPQEDAAISRGRRETIPLAKFDCTVDRLGRLSLWQPRRGYRFSIGSVLLAAFAPTTGSPIADLGAGCRILCLLLGTRGMLGPFAAVELAPPPRPLLSAQLPERRPCRSGVRA